MPEPKHRDQSFLGDPPEHIPIPDPRVVDRSSRKVSGRGRKWFAKKTDASPDSLVEAAENVLRSTSNKGRIFPDPNIYFVMHFSDTFRSPIIQKVVANLAVDIVESLAADVVKVRTLKQRYEKYLDALRENAAYIVDVKESSLSEKIDADLLNSVGSRPDEKFNVNIQIAPSESGLLEDLVGRLSTYAESGGRGKVRQAFWSDRFVLLSCELQGRSIQAIAQDLDAVNRINLAAPVTLESSSLSPLEGDSGQTNSTRLELAEVVRAVTLPPVCVVDSGLNRNHERIRPHVVGTHDFVDPVKHECQDNLGHGTMVSGLAIYEGKVTNPVPSCDVIAVKLFDTNVFSGDILPHIDQTIGLFHNACTVFNFSFGSQSQIRDEGGSKALDYLSYDHDVLFVVAAGNISFSTIMHELSQGKTYPDYIMNHQISFPGHCFNTLTVGSYAEKGSKFVPKECPSPFTRSRHPQTEKMCPEILSSGGNADLLSNGQGGQTIDYHGLGIVSTWKDGNSLEERVGTSFACPIVSSIVAQLVRKFPGKFPCFYKALLVSSCQELNNDNRAFPSEIQGFGVPDKVGSLFSDTWRVNLYAQSNFYLRDWKKAHLYSFPFPGKADRIKVTICFDVEPILGFELPYHLRIRLHKPGTKSSAWVKPRKILPSFDSNIVVYEYPVQRGGRSDRGGGNWELSVSPKLKPALYLRALNDRRLRYAIIITVISDDGEEIYGSIKKALSLQTPKREIALPLPVSQ